MQSNHKWLCVVLCGIILMSMLLVVMDGIAVDPPETARILFVSDRKAKKNKDIFAMDPDGGNVDRITKHAKQDVSPSWSRDGTKIVFASNRDEHFERIYIMDNNGDNIIKITNGNRDLYPSWSPNGNWIAAVHAHGADNWNFDVWVVRLPEDTRKLDPFPFVDLGDGDQINSFRLTRDPGQDETPSWAPDGKQIAWSSNRTGSYDIFVMDITGENKTNVTKNSPKNDKGPDWQPLWGEKILFESDRDGDSEIYVMDPDGRNVKQLTQNKFIWDGQPTWSPNGKQIAFATNRVRNNEIFVMDANGNNPVNLTNDPAFDSNPAWFDPRIAFSVSSKAKHTVTWGEIKQSGQKPSESQ